MHACTLTPGIRPYALYQPLPRGWPCVATRGARVSQSDGTARVKRAFPEVSLFIQFGNRTHQPHPSPSRARPQTQPKSCGNAMITRNTPSMNIPPTKMPQSPRNKSWGLGFRFSSPGVSAGSVAGVDFPLMVTRASLTAFALPIHVKPNSSAYELATTRNPSVVSQ